MREFVLWFPVLLNLEQSTIPPWKACDNARRMTRAHNRELLCTFKPNGCETVFLETRLYPCRMNTCWPLVRDQVEFTTDGDRTHTPPAYLRDLDLSGFIVETIRWVSNFTAHKNFFILVKTTVNENGIIPQVPCIAAITPAPLKLQLTASERCFNVFEYTAWSVRAVNLISVVIPDRNLWSSLTLASSFPCW